MGLVRYARLTRRQLIVFALMSAVVNGIVTASVGAWLAQTYASYTAKRQSIDNISALFYTRRTRAGLVVSSLRRGADVDEVKDRKRAYDQAYVEWNANIRRNLFVIRDVMGARSFAPVEQTFEDGLVAALGDIDACLTKAYDTRVQGGDPRPILEACHMPDIYQFSLDCGASFTNELFKLTQLSFIPFFGNSTAERAAAEGRITKYCTRPAPGTPAAPGSAPATDAHPSDAPPAAAKP